MGQKVKRILKAKKQQVRFFDSAFDSYNEEKKTLTIVFSTETPYPRNFGTDVLEVIGHGPGDMDLSRLLSKAIVLFNHDFDKPIGVVEKAWIQDNKGYAEIRLSSTAYEISTMIQEGILNKISFGYEITDIRKIGEKDGIAIVSVKTLPYELSVVTVPADNNAEIISRSKKSETSDEDVEAEFEDDETEEEKSLREKDEAGKEEIKQKALKQAEEEALKEEEKKEAQRLFDINKSIEENNARTIKIKREKMDEKEQIQAILALGAQYKEFQLASEFIKDNKTVDQFQKALLEKMSSKGSGYDAGSEKELSTFNFGAYVLEQVEGRNGDMTSRAREMSQDFHANGWKAKANTIVLSRKLINMLRLKQIRASGNYLLGTAAAGGNTASNDYRPDVIDALYNQSVWQSLATQMPSATGYGSVTYPIVTSVNNVEMLGEGAPASASRNEFDNVIFLPKTAKGKVKLSREIMKTSSLNTIESFAMNALQKAMNDKRNDQYLNGTGTGGEVLGLFNLTGVNAVAMGTNGGAITNQKVIDLETAVAVANSNLARCAYVTNSKVAGVLKGTQRFASFGSAILEGGKANGYDVLISNGVKSNYTKGTSGAVCSAMAFVNPEYALTCEWDGVEYFVNPYTGDGAIQIESFDTFDLQFAKPQTISVAKDILA